MNGRALRVGFVSIALLFLLFCSTVPTSAQGEIGRNGGNIKLKSDIEMMSGIPVHGGGHLTWTFTEAAARELRVAIIAYYDIPHGQLPANGQLDLDEVDSYAKDLERYLEGRDEEDQLKYMGAKLRRFSLLNYDVQDDVKGLIRTTAQSTDDIIIRFYFDASMPYGEEVIPLTDTVVVLAPLQPVNETYWSPGTITIEHTEYMVSVGDFTDVNIEQGTFYLIRTPFGDIFYYESTFTAGDPPNERVTYQHFNWIECPLVLFIMVALLGYFTATMPGRFRRYDVTRINKVHTFAKVLVVILLLLYFFAAFGGIFIGGIFLWILAFVFLFVSIVVSKSLYDNAKRITDERKIEDMVPAAAAAPVDEPIETEPEEEDSDRPNVQCKTCGDIFRLQEYDTPASAVCPSCGSMGGEVIGEPKGPEDGETYGVTTEPAPAKPKPPPPRPPRAPKK